jgi:hypothetical protein
MSAFTRWWQRFKREHVVADDPQPAECPLLEYLVRTEHGIYFAYWAGYGEPAFTSRMEQAARFTSRWAVIQMIQQIEATLPAHERTLGALWTVIPIAKMTAVRPVRVRWLK